MWSSPWWTQWARRCPSARRPPAEGSRTPRTRRLSPSRWRSSSCQRWRSCCRFTPGEVWSAETGWAGSLSVSTAPGKWRPRTGSRWGKQRDSKCVSGSRSWTPRPKREEEWNQRAAFYLNGGGKAFLQSQLGTGYLGQPAKLEMFFVSEHEAYSS